MIQTRTGPGRRWRPQDRHCHPRVPLPGALRPLPLAADRTGCPSPLPALGAAQLHSFHGFGLTGSFQNVQSLPRLPNPRPWLSAPKRAGTHPGPGRGPLSRLVASPLVTPGGQLGARPHQLPPPGRGRGLREQPVPPACVPSPFRGWKTGGSPYPALHPRTGQLRNRVCCDSLRGLLPRGPSGHSERASQASRRHLGGFGGNRCPAAWLRFLGLRETQSCAPRPPTDRGLGWAGLQVA